MINYGQKEISDILQAYLVKAKSINNQYSLRSLAAKLSLNPGVLSQIVNGKRNISEKQAKLIVEALNFSPELSEQFLSPFKIKEKISSVHKSSPNFFDNSLFEDEEVWMAFAILNLIETQNFVYDPEYISKRLSIDLATVEIVLEKIFSQGLASVSENNELIRTKKKLKTVDNIQNDKLANGHKINCKMAEESIDLVPVGLRDFTSMTMPINTAKLESAKEIIRKFHDELSVVLEHGEKDEVYKLNVQLFPLSK